jgi:hypothetical protein
LIGLGILIAGFAPCLKASAAPDCTVDTATGTRIDAQPFIRNDYGIHWKAGTNRLAYMQPNAEGYYRVFTVWADGSGAKRLTRMNVNRRDNPQNASDMLVAGKVTVRPEDSFMLADVQDSLMKQTGFVRPVRFNCD